MDNLKFFRRLIVGSILLILILTVLEFPAPIGFEVRPQDNVSMLWLVLFLAVLISEIITLPLIFKKPKAGAYMAILAAFLNIIQIIADQTHMMQPEIAPLGYLLLEDSVGILSLLLAYSSWRILRELKLLTE